MLTIEWANSILTVAILSLLRAKYGIKKCCLKKGLEKQVTADLQKYMKVFLRTQLGDSARSVFIEDISSYLF